MGLSRHEGLIMVYQLSCSACNLWLDKFHLKTPKGDVSTDVVCLYSKPSIIIIHTALDTVHARHYHKWPITNRGACDMHVDTYSAESIFYKLQTHLMTQYQSFYLKNTLIKWYANHLISVPEMKLQTLSEIDTVDVIVMYTNEPIKLTRSTQHARRIRCLIIFL